MRLFDYLRVPYLIEASTVDHVGAESIRRAEYIELPECWAEAESIVDALETLDRRRVEVIVEMLRAGVRPIVPRPPIDVADPIDELKRLGLFDKLAASLDLDEADLTAATARD
jgi:hypothetical protein